MFCGKLSVYGVYQTTFIQLLSHNKMGILEPYNIAKTFKKFMIMGDVTQIAGYRKFNTFITIIILGLK